MFPSGTEAAEVATPLAVSLLVTRELVPPAVVGGGGPVLVLVVVVYDRRLQTREVHVAPSSPYRPAVRGEKSGDPQHERNPATCVVPLGENFLEVEAGGDDLRLETPTRRREVLRRVVLQLGVNLGPVLTSDTRYELVEEAEGRGDGPDLGIGGE